MAWLGDHAGNFSIVGLDLDTPQSQAYGVNTSGVVVGRAVPDSGGIYAFAHIPDLGAVNLFDVTDPESRKGWQRFSSAQDITSDGTIVGWGVYSENGYNSQISSFVLTPISSVPLPSAIPFFILGIFTLVGYKKLSKESVNMKFNC